MVSKSISTFIFLAIAATVYGKRPSKIFNGKVCRFGEWPFIVSMYKNGAHHCGGSLISDRHVLTAAHCVADITIEERERLIIRSRTVNSRAGGQEHRVAKILYHINYNSSDSASPYDIAVIKLKAPVIFDENQKWIALASTPTRTGEPTTVIGWGYTESHLNSASWILKKVALTTLEPSRCQPFLKERLGFGQICGVGKYGEGVCMGDSGGPLVNLYHELVGVVSWGIPCARGVPDVFTRVYNYRSWIYDAMQE